MARKTVLVLILLAMVAALITMACHPPPPAHCSQGFWKNKGYEIYGPYDTDDLYARGHGSGAIRDARTAQLNAQFFMADQYCLD